MCSLLLNKQQQASNQSYKVLMVAGAVDILLTLEFTHVGVHSLSRPCQQVGVMDVPGVKASHLNL